MFMQNFREMYKIKCTITCMQFVNDQLIFWFLNDLKSKILCLTHFYFLQLKMAIHTYKNIQNN